MPRVDNELFYTASLRKYGVSARGVQWRSAENQQVRFAQIASLILAGAGQITVVDAGCGFGDLYRYLAALLGERLEYIGIDVHESMVRIARERTGETILRRDILRDPLPEGDYYLCSGALNILTPEESGRFIRRCFGASRRGFVFNFLEGEDTSQTYNYLRSGWVEELSRELGGRCLFRRGYLEDDCTAALYK